ncbi:MAG: hypothetical protein K2W82_06665 [Candidatus Obscuribacterales bacterium]|nr:hypothetical protein [Candidatus Obscuribacterales bacterium]
MKSSIAKNILTCCLAFIAAACLAVFKQSCLCADGDMVAITCCQSDHCCCAQAINNMLPAPEQKTAWSGTPLPNSGDFQLQAIKEAVSLPKLELQNDCLKPNKLYLLHRALLI